MNAAYEHKLELEEVIVRYLPLIKKIVDQVNLTHTQYEKEDMIHIGVLGLIDAFQRYDSGKGIPFQHYAKWRIRGSIIDEMRKSGKVSRDKMKKIKQFYQAQNDLRQQLMREPSDEEICRVLSIARQELYDIEENIHYLSQYSLEEVLFSGDEGEFERIDVLEDKRIQTPEEELLEKERKERLAEAVEKLPERERLILALYYKEELTLKEIAGVLGVSLSRVSQIHGKTLLKLRGYLKAM
jgi:RNA polymerase sigma factor for flagellar operon FliA